ncbi:hypothetical protein TNCT_382521 [Trichonephila clavata]|uniref:Uncharacterized protein n=1 Tax=Trichonephila clavata TaxID=2740835 RepID=A0A8X6LHF4_TRICU|nr:hypothetical protein TNCT_382521 [Trichonephila clavata]
MAMRLFTYLYIPSREPGHAVAPLPRHGVAADAAPIHHSLANKDPRCRTRWTSGTIAQHTHGVTRLSSVEEGRGVVSILTCVQECGAHAYARVIRSVFDTQ